MWQVLSRMISKTYLKVIGVAFAGAFVSCASRPETLKTPVSTALRPDSSLSAQVLNEVEKYRGNHGAGKLQRHPGLDRLAQQHSEFLRKHRGEFGIYGKNVSHFGFEGRSLYARECYHMENISENVASLNKNSNTAASLVNLWANSKNHEYNMRSSWTHTGIGVVVDSDGTVFATQLFATVTQSQMTTRERFNQF